MVSSVGKQVTLLIGPGQNGKQNHFLRDRFFSTKWVKEKEI
jgi:hypothetical protein